MCWLALLYTTTIFWRGSDIRFLVNMKRLKKLDTQYFVQFLTEMILLTDILDGETNDAIRKITSKSCICKNENNVKWIPFYTKNK